MTTMYQMETCLTLEAKGLKGVSLPCGDETPIPGLILFADEGHTRLEMVQGDGSIIDLLAVHRLAGDCVRNWHKGSDMPQFVGDFKRLTPLAKALNGRRP